ncbi:unnamed protein product [Schistosoma mattheei]|uniref:Uncharacterized protein n=1 Tax=Schistosoma mattheei TaxID=31246 RepID=A0A183NHI4_9TREM|nr:unnamed protein product [Schistosoma mattheei]
MYESCLEEVFKAIKKRRSGQVSVMIASHNEDTVRYALKKLDDESFGIFSFTSTALLCGPKEYPDITSVEYSDLV